MKPVLFYIMAAIIVIGSFLTVTSSRILRAAVYLLFVLIATAGIYFLMDYTFLAASQLTLYAGGIIVLIIFSVMLTSSAGERQPPVGKAKAALAALGAAAGAFTCIATYLAYNAFPARSTPADTGVKALGAALVSTGENGYMLPFEVISVLLLAAMIAAIIIARRDVES